MPDTQNEPPIRCAVVATSTGSLDELPELDDLLYILRLNVHLDGLVYADGYDLHPEAFYLWQAETPEGTASTSPPAESAVRDLFKEIIDLGYREIIVTTLSGRISGTVDTVRKVAAEMARDIQTYIIDTGTACIAEGHFALEAVRLLRFGFAAADVAEYLERLKPTAEIVFSVNNLRHLHHLNTTEKFFAGLLDLKPVLRFYDGQFSRADIGMGRKTEDTLDALADTAARAARAKPVRLYGLYGGDRALYERLAEKLQNKTGLTPAAFPISPVIGAHIGADAVGVCWVDEPL
ncbi:TPA: DegV family protein [Neisseria bacilliformis]|uniref:DegV family protein n=1 Tax=Neisseria bacilliformis TaxID=267212 RepID=UPI000668E525|nr:DegV family protein [Neisseria bacilliformis]